MYIYFFFSFSCFCLFCPEHYASQTSSPTRICSEGLGGVVLNCGRCSGLGARRRGPRLGWTNRCPILPRSFVSSLVVILHGMGGCLDVPLVLRLCLYTLKTHEIPAFLKGFLDALYFSRGNRFPLLGKKHV